MIASLLNRLRLIVSRKKIKELDEEIAFHLDQATATKISTGMAVGEARRQALIEFGGTERTREQCHRQRPGWWFGTVLQDVRYAVRGFRRNPIFTAAILLTLALGIGATTAVFSVVDPILFRPLPYVDPSRLVSVGFVHSLERQEFVMGRFYAEWQNEQTAFSALAAQSTGVRNCDLVENNPLQLNCMSFQASFLPLLGVPPVLGRNFLSEEDRPNGPPVAMISYALWKGHYSSDPAILSRLINVDGQRTQVVGVLPKEFQFPTLETADVILPFAFDAAAQQAINGGFGNPMRLFARLRPGVSVAQASERMQPLFQEDLKSLPPAAKDETQLSVRSLRDREMQEVRPVAWILLGFVLAVLLIVFANVAGLLIARAAARQRELAVRSAIGASKGRLIRQALTETSILSLAGGLSGTLLAQLLLVIFVHLAPTGIPFLSHARLDLRIEGFAILVSLLCSLVFGVAAMFHTPSTGSLNGKGSLSRQHTVWRRSLVTAQIAISIVLLSGAGLLFRSFRNIQQQQLGMQTGGVLTSKIALPQFRYDTDQKVMSFYLRVEQALRSLPGTRGVAITDSLPPGGWEDNFRFSDTHVEGRPPIPSGTGGTVTGRSVTPDYFRVLSIPFVRGRNFTEAQRTGTEHEVILSRALASKLFPGEDPIGKRLLPGAHINGNGATIVGVADDVKNNGLTEQSHPEMYTLRRSEAGDWGGTHLVLMVDSVMTPDSLEPWVRSSIASVDPTVPIDMDPLKHSLGQLADLPRFETALVGFFALTGLVLSIVGLYGLMTFLTTQRTHEIGVRMALGATRANILKLVAGDGLRMVTAGSLAGVAVALAASHILRTLLFGVSVYDPFTYVTVPLLIAEVSFVAILIPARAGAHIDPVATLRSQ